MHVYDTPVTAPIQTDERRVKTQHLCFPIYISLLLFWSHLTEALNQIPASLLAQTTDFNFTLRFLMPRKVMPGASRGSIFGELYVQFRDTIPRHK